MITNFTTYLSLALISQFVAVNFLDIRQKIRLRSRKIMIVTLPLLRGEGHFGKKRRADFDPLSLYCYSYHYSICIFVNPLLTLQIIVVNAYEILFRIVDRYNVPLSTNSVFRPYYLPASIFLESRYAMLYLSSNANVPRIEDFDKLLIELSQDTYHGSNINKIFIHLAFLRCHY